MHVIIFFNFFLNHSKSGADELSKRKSCIQLKNMSQFRVSALYIKSIPVCMLCILYSTLYENKWNEMKVHHQNVCMCHSGTYDDSSSSSSSSSGIAFESMTIPDKQFNFILAIVLKHLLKLYCAISHTHSFCKMVSTLINRMECAQWMSIFSLFFRNMCVEFVWWQRQSDNDSALNCTNELQCLWHDYIHFNIHTHSIYRIASHIEPKMEYQIYTISSQQHF